MMYSIPRLRGTLAVCFVMAAATSCASSGANGGEGGGAATSTGGSARGGGAGSGGIVGSGGVVTAGVVGSGGDVAAGGVVKGGVVGASGGTSAGGAPATGGAPASGGTTAGGGAIGTGGGTVTGGAAGRTGVPGTGGLVGAGGARVGGATGKGGATGNGGVPGMGGVVGAGGTLGGTSGGGGIGTGGTSSTCPLATPLSGGKQYCSNGKGSAGGNYAYELWAEGTGSGCMTVHGVDATFSATWSNVEDFLARVGLDFDRSKTPAQIGTISSDFAETKTGDSGLTYVGIYGWTVDPLREYYIIEDWGSTKPAETASDGTPRTYVGTLVADGDTYDVWKKTRVDKPAITGDHETFDQYFSVRQTARQCGHISVSKHFSEWTKLGLPLGKLVEAKLLVEAQNNSGSVAFTTATVVVAR